MGVHADRTTTDDELVDRCRDHIAAGRTTLWGQFFDVYDPAGLDQAARWLAAEIRGVLG